jgi:N-acetylmuramoyl-L-alanine amidase
VRRLLAILLLVFLATAIELPARQPGQQPPLPPNEASPVAQTPAVAQVPPVPERRLNVVMLDPGHGGTDPGARGATGAVEKDIVLALARATRAELERQGFRVVMTREGDQNPSFEDRAALANAQRGAIFISFHVASTGAAGTVRAYSYQFSTTPDSTASADPSNPGLSAPAPVPAGWIAWNVAQKPHTDLSRRLADVLQVELSQKFKGSLEISSAVPVRGLRSVVAPAVAVELSSVAVADPRTLYDMAPVLATAIARAVAAFRPLYEGAK